MTPVSLAGFTNMTALSSRGVSEPFAATRDGFVMAEGAGGAHPRGLGRRRGPRRDDPRRGARRRVAPPTRTTSPPRAPGGRGALSCMELALADAGPRRGRHRARSTPTAPPRRSTTPPRPRPSRRCSARPARRSRRSRASPATRSAPPVRSRPSRSSSRCATASSRRPPVTTEVDPELPPIDLVIGEPRPWEPGPTLSNSFGFGGHNGSLVLGAVS